MADSPWIKVLISILAILFLAWWFGGMLVIIISHGIKLLRKPVSRKVPPTKVAVFDKWLGTNRMRLTDLSIEQALLQYMREEHYPNKSKHEGERDDIKLMRARIDILRNSAEIERPEVLEWVVGMESIVEMHDESSEMQKAFAYRAAKGA